VDVRDLRTTLTNQSFNHGNIESRSNACRRSVRSISSWYLMSKNLSAEICQTKCLPIALCGCETWSVMLSEDRRTVRAEGGNRRRIELRNEEFVICAPLHTLLE
jgi:hypothetical protein